MTKAHTDILRDLANKIYNPIYLLEGEEPYFIDLVTECLEQTILPESERSFNQTIIYGKETTAMDIRTRAMNYPMFSNYQVLILKEAQELKKWDDLLPYFEKPVKSTILVLCHKYSTFDKRTRSAKAIHENGIVMTSKKLYENQLPAFVEEKVSNYGLSIHPHATALIVEYIGNNLSRIVHELEKLKLNLKGKKEVTTEDVELNIGVSKEYNTFELNKALASRDLLKANRIIEYFEANPKPNPLILTLGSLHSYFSKIYVLQKSDAKRDGEMAGVIGVNPFILSEYKMAARNYPPVKVEEIFSLLHEYDLRSKGINDTGTRESALLKELVFKILH